MTKNLIFFTKTAWNEPPRLRHQLSSLLADNGHEILFFEKPSTFPIPERPTLYPIGKSKSIVLTRSSELIHHKLRLSRALASLNALHETRSIKKIIDTLNYDLSNCVIINFNYDYYFLRSIFPVCKIITIINDDFVCRALFGYKRPLKYALAAVCEVSDVVLAVSEPLVEQLSPYCQPLLFLPWSSSSYVRPSLSGGKRFILFWGYINNRLDFDYLIQLAKGLSASGSPLCILLVGPVQDGIDSRYNSLLSMSNVRRWAPRCLDELPVDDTLAAIIPYVMGNPADDATTIPNKALPLLSRGIPLLITGMPRFFEASFVFRLGLGISADIDLISNLELCLPGLQVDIEDFVDKHSASRAYSTIAALIG